jgi:hypothetical protein
MNRSAIALGVAAAVLTVAGCSSNDGATDPTPNASASSSPTSTKPESSATSSVAPSAGASTLSLVESCRAALADQRDAVTQLRTYVKNPVTGDVTAQDVDQARQRLQADAEQAAAPLQNELRTQVDLLTRAVKGIRTKDVKAIDVPALQKAQTRVTQICDSAGS